MARARPIRCNVHVSGTGAYGARTRLRTRNRAVIICAFVLTALVFGYWYFVYRPYRIRLLNVQRSFIKNAHPNFSKEKVEELRKAMFE